MTHLPGAVQIVDYYRAAGHLGEYCDLLPPQGAMSTCGSGRHCSTTASRYR